MAGRKVLSQSAAAAATTQRHLLDVDQVAQALAVTPRQVRRLVAERRIPFVKVGRFVRFDPGALDVWLDQQCVDVRRSAPGSSAAGR